MNMDLLQCEICEKTFKGRCGKTNLSKHLQQHGKEMDLFEKRCDTCDKIFTSKWELEVHKFKHEERYECNVCNKTFASPICLTRHKEDVYRSLKKFKCYICDSAFKSSIQMAQHIKIVHNRTKEYECEVCSSVFYSLSKLNCHRKVHDQNQVPCDLCGTIFNTKLNLSNHIKRVHEGRKFKCDICENIFNTKAHLTAHLNCHWRKIIAEKDKNVNCAIQILLNWLKYKDTCYKFMGKSFGDL